MKIQADWKRELELKPIKTGNALFTMDTDSLHELPGIYVFIRKYENKAYPLYVGQASNIKRRIIQHQNNLKLMLGILRAGKGQKCVLYCTITAKQGQRRSKILAILEKALMDHCLTQGYELLNKQGTKVKYEVIRFTGNRTSEDLFGRKMLTKRKHE